MNSIHARVFQSQEIFCPDKEPICIEASDNVFFVALAAGMIRGYSAHTSEQFHKLYEFSALSPKVISMQYLPKLKILITIEQDETERRYCRMYQLFFEVRLNKTIIKSCAIPAGNKVEIISTCKHSNLLLVGTSNGVLTLWKIQQVQNASLSPSQQLLYSSVPAATCLLKIHSSWSIKSIALHNDYLAYASESAVRVLSFDLKKEHAAKSQQPPHSNNSIHQSSGLCVFWGVSHANTDIENFVEVRFSAETQELLPSKVGHSATTFKQASGAGRAVKPQPRSNQLGGASAFQNYHVLGEGPNADHPTFINQYYVSSCKNVIHKQLKNLELAKSLHFMSAKPMLTAQDEQTNPSERHVKFVVSTSQKGYVFDLQPTVQFVTELEYCGECIVSGSNSFFLFVLTPAGMEIWATLGGHGCLLRSHPFIGLKAVAPTNSHVSLLSKFSNDENLSLAAYYNASATGSTASSNLTILSDIRNIDKLQQSGKNSSNSTESKGSVLPLFTGARRRPAQQAQQQQTQQVAPPEPQYSYNVYLLNQVELCEICEDLWDKAMDVEKTNPEQYVMLLKEAHHLLHMKQQELVASLSETKDSQQQSHASSSIYSTRLQVELFNYTNLLRKSYGMLGDMYISQQHYELAAAMYAQSDRTMSEIQQRFENKPQQLLTYLEQVLFDLNTPPSQISEHICNTILELYRRFMPAKLSSVILESRCQEYSPDVALRLIQEVIAEDSQGSTNQEPEIQRPKDAFVLGLLLLEAGKVEQSLKVFESTEPHCIIEFSVANPGLLEMNSGKVSVFSTLLFKYFPWCLLEILVRLRDVISLQNALKILSQRPSLPNLDRVLQEQYLTCYILRPFELASSSVHHHRQQPSSSVVDISEAILLLMDHYVDELTISYQEIRSAKYVTTEVSTPTNSSDVDLEDEAPEAYLSEKSEVGEDLDQLPPSPASLSPAALLAKSLADIKEWSSFLQNTFIPFRHKWLDAIQEQEEESEAKEGNVIMMDRNTLLSSVSAADSGSISEEEALFKAIGASSAISDLTFKALVQPLNSVLRYKFILYSAQGLLCFSGMAASKKNLVTCSTPAEHILSRLVAKHPFSGKLSLKVLCLTTVSQYHKAVDLLLNVIPAACFDYVKQYIPATEEMKKEWKAVLEKLFELARKEEQETSMKKLIGVLEKCLWHVAANYHPKSFLELLPTDGNVDFFLPFISHSCSQQCAREAKVDMGEQQEDKFLLEIMQEKRLE